MHEIILTGLFTPLLGFLILLTFGSVLNKRLISWVGCSTVFISFACFVTIFYTYHAYSLDPIHFFLYNWVPVKGINADFALLIDPLSLLMTLVITGVGFLIHVYSIGYMEHEKDYARFFACMNLFIFSMLLLVLASNLLLLFVGWEGVGLVSYLLIGFWYDRPAAARAATKAFVINRIGDLGLLLGLLLTFHTFGTGDIDDIIQKAHQGFQVGAPLLGIITLLYFVGATGKSAQLPLQTWLPDAMEGPTPVSALIHAATMVTAGVYLVVRMHPVFMLAPDTLHFVGYVGAATALFASLCAAGQTDLKRVLAYSTISQLGLMFLACGVGAFFAAMFHLTMHAFMKALLFLSAGNVLHMTHGVTDMNRLGGLAKKLPKTNILFIIGVLAMSGVPPLAAFFSKDLILEEEYLAGSHTLFYIGLFISLLTAFYLTRAYCLTFLGESRLEEKNLEMVKEAPLIMILPVSILAILSIIGGFLGFSVGKPPAFEEFLAEVDVTFHSPILNTGFHFSFETFLSIFGAVVGIGSALLIYTRYKDRLGPTWENLKRAFYIDEIYWNAIVLPLKAVSKFIVDFAEPKIFDGSIQLASHSIEKASVTMQRLQSGQIRAYVAWMAIGMGLLLVYFTF